MRFQVFLIGVLIAAPCVAQNQYLQPVPDAEHDLTVALLRMHTSQVQQDAIDKQQRLNASADQQPQEKVRPAVELQKLIVSDSFGYAEVFSGQPDAEINQTARNAIRLVRAAHPGDFDRLAPSMKIIAGAMKPDWQQVTMAEYVEALYAVAKNATFAQSARAVGLDGTPKTVAVSSAPRKE
jgi:hypothetical protein